MTRDSSHSMNNQKITFAMIGIIGLITAIAVHASQKFQDYANGLWMSIKITDM
jgi:hypothetical protein